MRIISTIARAFARDDESFLRPHSLVISSSTYEKTEGAIASLNVGTALANTNTATIPTSSRIAGAYSIQLSQFVQTEAR